MNKTEQYRQKLAELADWEPYLLAESGLPGPRGNLELAQAAADVGETAVFRRLLAAGDRDMSPDAASVFLTVCGLIGLGRLLAEGSRDVLEMLRRYANDPRWRAREGAAMALQRWGDTDMDSLLAEMQDWARGSLLERRAAAAAVCEPRLIRRPEYAERALNLLNVITAAIPNLADRRSAEFIALRKALGYCWSVAAAALPERGKAMMETWFDSADKDVRWIMRENLKKARLSRMDAAWVEAAQARLA